MTEQTPAAHPAVAPLQFENPNPAPVAATENVASPAAEKPARAKPSRAPAAPAVTENVAPPAPQAPSAALDETLKIAEPKKTPRVVVTTVEDATPAAPAIVLVSEKTRAEMERGARAIQSHRRS